MIYLDNAATTNKKPKSVINAVNNALTNYSVNTGRGGYSLAISAGEKIYNTRKAVAEFFSLNDPAGVVFTPSCTQAINMVLKGNLGAYDEVLISNLEHNAVVRPCYKLSENGVKYRLFDAFSDNIYEELNSKISENTKMVFCTHASNVCGKVLPLKEIGEFCKNNNLLFGVDCAQTAGVFPISMADMNIDFLCVAPHKGLFAPTGTGILLSRKNIEKTVIEGGTGVNSTELRQPTDLPERLESGTLNLPGIFGVFAGVNFVKNIGVSKIYEHENALCNYLKKGMEKNKKIKKYWFDGVSAPVLSFAVENRNSEEIAEEFNKRKIAVRAGLHCAPIAHKTIGSFAGGTVRVSPSFFNTKQEIDYFLNSLELITKKI